MKETLEHYIDTHGFNVVIAGLAMICREKAEHLRLRRIFPTRRAGGNVPMAAVCSASLHFGPGDRMRQRPAPRQTHGGGNERPAGHPQRASLVERS
jgi:hypothetical protein